MVRRHDENTWWRRHGEEIIVSKSGVVVGGRGHLQDALSVLLHQGAPLHLPSQDQIVPIQSVNVLHLQRGQGGRGRGSCSQRSRLQTDTLSDLKKGLRNKQTSGSQS